MVKVGYLSREIHIASFSVTEDLLVSTPSHSCNTAMVLETIIVLCQRNKEKRGQKIVMIVVVLLPTEAVIWNVMNQKWKIRKNGDSFDIQPSWKAWWRSKKDKSIWIIHFERYRPPTKDDELKAKMRGYYFAEVAQALEEETGHSKITCHESMKAMFSSYADENTGMLIIRSVWSNESDMSNEERSRFIKNVRSWASDFLNVYIPDPQKIVG